MEHYLETYRRAIQEEIAKIHARGFPVFQSKDGYIIAIYPGGREVKLQKEKAYVRRPNAE
jgi:biotin operon repressor